MRLRVVVVLLALVGVASVPAATPPFRAVLKAPAANPVVNVRWYYSLRVTDLRGRPIAATVTAHMLDPFGGVHPVEYGPTKKPIVGFRFKGMFRDYLEFPPESRGFSLRFRLTVEAKGKRRVLIRQVVPR